MNVQDLASWGANTEEGLSRCMGNESFYLRLAETMKTDGHFAELEAALGKGDLDAAFEAAHGLKGALANLALTPLLQPVSEMTELLRARTEMDYSELLAKVMEERDRFCAL